ncbi:MAG: hypothetical protein LBD99_03780 [Candidatus Margulisbacteria bacterium]|jgi:hypothetical protein|nr:hypothetical protein [Candidatus Margulisiibacteriota bacterium]
MKKVIIASVVLLSLVFAEFGAYIDTNASSLFPSNVPVGLGSYGAYWAFDKNIDLQGSIGGVDEDASGVNKGISFLILEGTYYILAKGDFLLGVTGIYTSLSGDGDTSNTIALGGSAKWKLNRVFALKADAIAYSSTSGKFNGDDRKGNAMLAGNSARIYAILDLF